MQLMIVMNPLAWRMCDSGVTFPEQKVPTERAMVVCAARAHMAWVLGLLSRLAVAFRLAESCAVAEIIFIPVALEWPLG